MNQLAPALTATFLFFTQVGLFAEEGDIPLPPRDQGIWQSMVMLGIACVFFYVILWRPEQKRRKELDQRRGNLSKGDRVTAMGIVGTVLKVTDQTVVIETAKETKIEVVKAAISEIPYTAGQEEEEPKLK